MKKIFIFATLAVLAACNSKEPATDDTKAADSMMAEIKSPYPVNYSSKFTMGDPKNAETVLNLWKIWDSGDLSAAKDIFADSVEMHFSSGAMMNSTRDSVLAMGQQERSKMTSSVSSVDAILSVKSTDKNEDWGLIWGKEINTYKDGKIDSSYIQETWRLNKDGKIDALYQFRAAAAPPKN